MKIISIPLDYLLAHILLNQSIWANFEGGNCRKFEQQCFKLRDLVHCSQFTASDMNVSNSTLQCSCTSPVSVRQSLAVHIPRSCAVIMCCSQNHKSRRTCAFYTTARLSRRYLPCTYIMLIAFFRCMCVCVCVMITHQMCVLVCSLH